MNNAFVRTLMGKQGRKSVLLMTHPGIELSGIKVIDAVTKGGNHFKAIESIYKRYPDADAVTTMMDLTVEAEAFGAVLRFSDNEQPSVEGRLLVNTEDVNDLDVPSISDGRIPEYLKACSMAAERIDKPVLAGAIGPFSLAGRLFGMTEIMIELYLGPDTVKKLLEKCTCFILEYVKAIKKTGAAGVVLAEPAAGLLSNDDCMLFSSVFVKKIVDECQDDSFAVILHNCGNSGNCTDAMVRTGACAYHFGNRMNMTEALSACPSDALVMGNLDPVGVFRYGSRETVRLAVLQLMEETESYGNFVISSGCDIPPGVPLENIDEFYETVKEK